MKILLDENIDVRFKKDFPQAFDVFTVKDIGWNGIKNGRLIQLITENEFDFWIVVDKNIPFQQNLKTLSFTIIILDVFRNTLERMQKLIPQLLEALNTTSKGNRCYHQRRKIKSLAQIMETRLCSTLFNTKLFMLPFRGSS